MRLNSQNSKHDIRPEELRIIPSLQMMFRLRIGSNWSGIFVVIIYLLLHWRVTTCVDRYYAVCYLVIFIYFRSLFKCASDLHAVTPRCNPQLNHQRFPLPVLTRTTVKCARARLGKVHTLLPKYKWIIKSFIGIPGMLLYLVILAMCLDPERKEATFNESIRKKEI